MCSGANPQGKITKVAAWRTREEALATTVARAEAVGLAKRVLVTDQELAPNAKLMPALSTSAQRAASLTPASDK